VDETAKRHRTILAALLAGVGLVSSMAVLAAPDDTSQREIAALLSFIAHSPCTFVRNGTDYGGAQAESHLEDKLHYLQQHGKIHSAEDFIRLAATESSLSGKPYLVRCQGKEQPSASWLTDELQRLRKAGP